ncbi:MAG TPA: alpha/beta hydrolase [Ktedonobacteraceae bacterium]
MPLDPQAQALVEQVAMMEEFYGSSLEEIRRRSDAATAVMGALEPVAHIENLTLDGPGGPLPVRIYTPAGSGPFPLLIYLHGGGWIVGNLEMAAPICCSLTNSAQCLVISVNYRLAPEHKFPAALEDIFATSEWAVRTARSFNGDPARLAIGGDSAGGNLAAAVTHMARDRGRPAFCYQVLLYPSTDHSATFETAGTGVEYTLNTLDRVRFHTASYLNSREEAANPLASPLLAENFADLPPALIITAEYDYLHEQGRLYAERLQAAGVPVSYKHYHDMMHGFINMAEFLDTGRQALTEVGITLRRALSSPSGVVLQE